MHKLWFLCTVFTLGLIDKGCTELKLTKCIENRWFYCVFDTSKFDRVSKTPVFYVFSIQKREFVSKRGVFERFSIQVSATLYRNHFVFMRFRYNSAVLYLFNTALPAFCPTLNRHNKKAAFSDCLSKTIMNSNYVL